ncbi:hypothetical protein GDO78_011912 [Eleutherodactylus coqui]|uniref:Uncharacterized protein n=1 Tax=Eleutherodactylus coqui TaxID=57060 RepID=A0A8J6F1E7_ELECQ|nr:hypothetical protein GDO78_011912 [Eleutherodactylus coqui]
MCESGATACSPLAPGAAGLDLLSTSPAGEQCGGQPHSTDKVAQVACCISVQTMKRTRLPSSSEDSDDNASKL